MPGPYSAGRVYVQVVPSFRGLQQTLRKAFNAAGKDASEAFSEEFEKGSKGGLFTPQARNEVNKEAEKAGDEAAEKLSGAFQKTLRRRLQAMGSTLGKGISPELDEMRKTIEALDKKVKPGFDSSEILRGLAAVKAAMQELHIDDDVELSVEAHFNSAKAIAEGRAMIADIEKSFKEAQIQVDVDLKVERMQGALEREIRSSVKAALADLPPIKLDVDSSQADRELAILRAKLVELDAIDPDLEIDAADAITTIAAVREQLTSISDTHVDIQVRVDSAVAAAKLAAIERQVASLDHETIEIDVDVDKKGGFAQFAENVQDSGASMRSFSLILASVVILGAALIPVLAGISAGLLAIMGAIPPLVAGLGILILAFSGISDAVGALGDVEKNAAKDATAAADKMRNASNTVAAAQRALVQAREDAARGIEDAIERQEDAERRLIDAQRDAIQAQEDLIEARERAKDQQEDLALDLKQNKLDERQAVIDLFEADRAFAAVLADPGATNKEKEEARLALEQARLTLERIRLEQERLTEEQKKTRDEGIEGSELVQSAQERLEAALRAQIEAEEAVGDAAEAVAQSRVDGAQRVEEAQRRLIESQKDYQDALYETSVLGSASQQKLTQAFDAIGPAGEAFAIFLFGLRDTFREIRDIAQEGMLPGVQTFLETILRENGPLLVDLIGGLSKALGDLFVQAGETFTDPTWQRFFQMIVDFGPGFIEKFGQVGLDILTFFAGLGTALAPFTDLFADALVGLSGQLADFGSSLFESEGFQAFLDYLTKIGPEVAEFLSALFLALVDVLIAMAPVGEQILYALTALFQTIAAIPPDILRGLIVGLLAFVAVLQVLAGLGVLISSIGTALAVITFILTLPFGAAILIIGALVVAFTALWLASETFRDIVKGAIEVVGDAFVWLWEEVIQPVSEWIWDALKETGEFFVGLWEDYIQPAIGAIADGWNWLWENALEPVFTFIWDALQVLGDIFMAVWEGFLSPVIQLWAAAIWWLWENGLQIVFGLIAAGWDLLVTGIEWAWTNILEPVWGAIATAADWLWTNVLEPVFGFIADRWDEVLTGMETIWTTVLEPVFNAIETALIYLRDEVFDPILNTLGDLWDDLVEMFKTPVDFIIETIINDGIIGGFNWLADRLGTPTLSEIPWPPAGWDSPPQGPVGRAMGGYIPGWSPSDRADNIPAMLTAGEYVLPVSAVRRLKRDFGADFLEQLRGYASGGPVFPLPLGSWTLGQPFSARHSGQDFPVASNTLVYSVLDGVVELVKYLTTSYGKHVMINHGNGIHSLYAHLNDIDVQQGWKVSAGQVIGASDSTGNSTGPHLHFEIRTPTGAYSDAINPMAFLNGAQDLGGGVVGLDPLKFLTDRLSGMFDELGSSPIIDILAAIPKKLVGLAIDKLEDFIAGIGDVINPIDPDNPFTPGEDRVMQIIQTLAADHGWGSGSQYQALLEIIQRESGFNPLAQNPTSTAYGLFQFLDSTWATVGATKTSDPYAQTVAGLRYIADRYGNPTGALAFHNSHGWYSEGGEVPANLYDTGGVIPPGLSMIVNKTGADETAVVMTPEQLQWANGGGGNLSLTLPVMNGPSVGEISDEILFRMRHARRGGVYKGGVGVG